MAVEEWKPIKGYEGKYAVSSFGRIKSIDRVMPHKAFGTWHIKERILKQYLTGPDEYKYFSVFLHSGSGEQKMYKVHRLVANAFLQKVEGKNVVNHKGCNKLNNHIENLEWCSDLENTRHAILNGRCDKAFEARRKKVLNVETGEVFKSMTEACERYGVSRMAIYQVIGKKDRKSCGFHWEFA